MTTSTTRAIPLREVAATFGVTAQTIRKWVKKGLFPRPLGCSRGKLLWSPRAVEQALLGRFPAGSKR
jgi:predicted DNA-binding transcriptional regulator AlpA